MRYKLLGKQTFLKPYTMPHVLESCPNYTFETSQAEIKNDQACDKMYQKEEIKIIEEYKCLSEIKVEPFDSYLEPAISIEIKDEYDTTPGSPSNQQNSDDSNQVEGFESIFVKEEFEAESTEKLPDQSNQPSKNRDLVHCPKCIKTWKLGTKLQVKCPVCGTLVKYKCVACAKIYASRSSYYSHTVLFHKEPRFNCDHCDFKSPCKERLANHVRSMHLPRDSFSFRCSRCEKTYRYRSSLNKHLKTCGLPPAKIKPVRKYFHCAHCNHKTHYKQSLVRHLISVHQPPDPSAFIKCKKCMRSYTGPVALRRHLKRCGMKPADNRALPVRFFCHHCDYKCKYKALLASHILARHMPRDINENKCPRCLKSYTRKMNLRRHMAICGEPTNETLVLRCHHCDFRTGQKSHMVSHLQSKHMSLSFRCENCGKSFRSQHNLIGHVSRYCKPRRKLLFCDDCGFETRTRQILVNHIQATHMSDRFVCKTCGTEFKAERGLREHNKYSSCGSNGEKRFECEECGFRSNYKSSLVTHKQSKHSEQVFGCEKCGRMCKNKIILRRHAKVCKKIVE